MNQGRKDAGSRITSSQKVQDMLASRSRYSGISPLQKLARERNWAIYVSKGMESLARFLYNAGWIDNHTYEQVKRAHNSISFSIDLRWYEKVDKLDRQRRRR